MKKTAVSIWKRITAKSSLPNGYATILALVCFGLLLQSMALLSVYISESAHLLKASAQSSLDLQIISKAKEIIAENQALRLCSEEGPSRQDLNRNITIDGKAISFSDLETCLDIVYEGVHLRLFYDARGLQGIEYY